MRQAINLISFFKSIITDPQSSQGSRSFIITALRIENPFEIDCELVSPIHFLQKPTANFYNTGFSVVSTTVIYHRKAQNWVSLLEGIMILKSRIH